MASPSRNSSLNDIILKHLQRSRLQVANGRISAGYVCTYIPAEIIEAAGAFPFRMLHGMNLEAETRGAAWLKSDSCSYCKACIGAFPANEFPVPDLVIGASPCDQMRRTLEHLGRDRRVKVLIIHVPRTTGRSTSTEMAGRDACTTRYYRDELERLGNAVASITGVDDWKERLPGIIDQRKQINDELLKLNSTRRETTPGITGKEAMQLAFATQELPSEISLNMLTEVTDNVKDRKLEVSAEATRLIVLGSVLTVSDLHIFDILENYASVVTADGFCSGIQDRYKSNATCSDPLMYLAESLMTAGLCPALRPNDQFYSRICNQVRDLHIEAAMLISLKFCHTWGFEEKQLKERLNIPFIHLDRDYSRTYDVQWRTRIEAFLEMLTMLKQAKPA